MFLATPLDFEQENIDISFFRSSGGAPPELS